MKKLIYIAGVVAVLGLIAWGISLMRPPNGAPLASVEPAATSTKSGPYYDATVAYPAAPTGELAVIKQALGAQVDDFVQSVSDLTPDMMPSLAGHKLAFDAQYKAYTGSGYTSYLYTIYEDTGGAHPNGFFKTFVFDARGTQATLGQVLSKNPNWLEELSLLVSQDVTKQVAARLGASAPQGPEGPDVTGAIFADGLAPKAENFENFVVDGDTLVIEIPPYQVAAYAMGSFEVRVPLSEINK